MTVLENSQFFPMLIRRYSRSPSVALCRVPELELLSRLALEEPVLDHCCGDGFVASTAFPGRVLDAGVDLDAAALETARRQGTYRQIVCADASKELPLDPESFGTVINNSGIEHIPDLEGALAQIARVLRPGGYFHFNVLNSRYFDWWPLAANTASEYRDFQPFPHALDEEGWTAALEPHGFADVGFQAYFPRSSATILADYDYRYSAFYCRRKPSAGVLFAQITPRTWLARRWRRLFGALAWDAMDRQGAGFMVTARKS